MSEIIAEEFGANATYVQGLLDRFRSNPDLVDESWRAYFSDLDGDLTAAVHVHGRLGSSTQAERESVSVQTSSAAVAPAPQVTRLPSATVSQLQAEATPIRGAAQKIVENMEASLAVPTATSQRRVPVKLLDENRLLINQYLQKNDRGKASYTHLIAWAILRALEEFPQLNDGFDVIDGTPSRLRRAGVNFGVAVDVEKRDGSRTLLVPNIKNANQLRFSQFLEAYDDVVNRARQGKLQLPDFQGTTISLTNPGTLGTVASTPRLMPGQALIIATGAIEYPAEYQAMAPQALSQLGISKVVTISNTYDHRIIQGAESGAFLARVHELLIGQHRFYDDIFVDLGIAHTPLRWNLDRNPFFLPGDQTREQTRKEAAVMELINAYRVRGHLIADIDPLHA
ncbi:MAG TPA: 2-oxo acid dehydrogenase subunit E2, partial [Pyrinomonadaceae bacterium]|nr:2-oxo acid dehydrogenase subunit E2 [Pyrinomonadaceae bacterium]